MACMEGQNPRGPFSIRSAARLCQCTGQKQDPEHLLFSLDLGDLGEEIAQFIAVEARHTSGTMNAANQPLSA